MLNRIHSKHVVVGRLILKCVQPNIGYSGLAHTEHNDPLRVCHTLDVSGAASLTR